MVLGVLITQQLSFGRLPSSKQSHSPCQLPFLPTQQLVMQTQNFSTILDEHLYNFPPYNTMLKQLAMLKQMVTHQGWYKCRQLHKMTSPNGYGPLHITHIVTLTSFFYYPQALHNT